MNTLRHRFTAANDPIDRPMNCDQIRTLLCDGLIELGAHTVTHPALTSLGTLERRREIVDSGNRCRELGGKSVTGFAYPYGDMSSEIQDEVARLGFFWACSTRGAFVEQPEIYGLPRIAVNNTPLETFIGLMTLPK